MTYQVLARKWRPRTFQELIGQGHVVQALTNALTQGRLHHAYLFTGTRGVGKTTVARVFAKALSCDHGVTANPCGVCAACVAIDEGSYVDLIEVDAASRTTVNETRELLDNIQYAPTAGRFKVYLIDEVHMFSGHSFNALLKTLEEPPTHVKFLLATTDPKKLPVTVLSRCLQFNLKRVRAEVIANHLGKLLEAENVTSDAGSRRLLAEAADGSVRDALSLTDQAIAYGGGALKEAEVHAWLGTVDKSQVVRLLQTLVTADGTALFAEIENMAMFEPDYGTVLQELLAVLHAIAVCQVLGPACDDQAGTYNVTELSGLLTPEDCQLYYQIGLHGRRDLPLAADPRRGFEMVMLRMFTFGRAEIESPDENLTTSTAPLPPSLSTAGSSHLRVPSSKRTSPSVTDSTTASYAEAEQSLSAAQYTDKPVDSVPDWGTMIASLKLTGMLRELALNCVLTEFSSNRLVLTLTPEFSHMRSETLEQRLEAQIKAVLGPNVKLKVATGDIGLAVTPAAQLAKQDAAAMAAAREAIENDVNVLKLKESFAAELQTDSVRPRTS